MATERNSRGSADSLDDEPSDREFEPKRAPFPLAARSRFRRRMLVGLSVWGLAMLVLKAVLYLRSQR